MRYNEERIDEVIKQDPIADAEKIIGRSLNGGDIGLALSLHMKRSQALNHMLASNGDTTFSMDINRYLNIIEKIGFIKVLQDKFDGIYGDDEYCYLYYKKPGQLLWCDTYRGNTRNTANVYYCWEPHKNVDAWQYTSNGSCANDNTWVGSHDAREAIIHKLTGLENNGKFIEPWPKKPFLWFCNWMETKNCEIDHSIGWYKPITNDRIKRLPTGIKNALGLYELE